MHRNIRETSYWRQMAADIYKTIRKCTNCAKNRVKLRKRTHPLRIFPTSRSLESLAIDILGPLTKIQKVHLFLLVMSYRFSKLTHVVPLRSIDAYTVAVAFVEAWVFKYGPPKTLISERSSPRNSSKPSARFSESRTYLTPRTTHKRTAKSNVITARSSQCYETTSTNTITTGAVCDGTHVLVKLPRTSLDEHDALHPNFRSIIPLNSVPLRQPNRRTITKNGWKT